MHRLHVWGALYIVCMQKGIRHLLGQIYLHLKKYLCTFSSLISTCLNECRNKSKACFTHCLISFVACTPQFHVWFAVWAKHCPRGSLHLKHFFSKHKVFEWNYKKWCQFDVAFLMSYSLKVQIIPPMFAAYLLLKKKNKQTNKQNRTIFKKAQNCGINWKTMAKSYQ